ncbi:MAG: hypothetical protein HW415_782, partial [Deltaproteobacteria bacterium]|nr:hypothetical protein [Deltaproteobacteria bacterium]
LCSRFNATLSAVRREASFPDMEAMTVPEVNS